MFDTVAYSQAQSLTLEAKHQTVAPAARFDSEMSVKQVRGVRVSSAASPVRKYLARKRTQDCRELWRNLAIADKP